MAKFNLKKILVNDYGVDVVKALNFEQWVGKNMDYEAVMEKNFKDISFKSSKTNKTDFLKDLKERALKLDVTPAIESVLDLMEFDGAKVNLELYEKIRKLELELKESNEIKNGYMKRIAEFNNKKEAVCIVNEIQEKIISEYAGFLRGFDLGFDINEYEKAIGRITFKRASVLKEILKENGVQEESINEIFSKWKETQFANFKEEVELSVDFKNYEENREELRQQFDFIKKNKEFVNTLLKLKGMKVFLEDKKADKQKSCTEVKEKEVWRVKTKELQELGKVFLSEIIFEKEHKTSWQNAARKIFGNSDRVYVFEKIGVNFKFEKERGVIVIASYDSKEEIIEKFNKKVREVLTNGNTIQS